MEILKFIGFCELANFLGALGSFLLLLAPLADQLRRLGAFIARKRAKRVSKGLQQKARAAAKVVEADVSRWRFWESATMGLGAIFLMISFWV